MKIRIALIAVLLLVLNVAATAAPLTAAVYNFIYTEKNPGGYGLKVTALVTAGLTTETNLIMLERADLAKALNEQAFDASGMVSSDAAAKIGQITGAKVLISGQVIKLRENRMVIIANVIGTETGRLFSDKVEGPMDQLMELTADLSHKIAQTISEQTTNLLAVAEESHAARMERINKNLGDRKRPTISVSIDYFGPNSHWRDEWAEYAFGKVLLETGFTVLDDKADRKADITITGNISGGEGPHRGDVHSREVVVEVKVQDRRTGNIIAFDRQTATVAGTGGQAITSRAGRVKAVDELAERILPLVVK